MCVCRRAEAVKVLSICEKWYSSDNGSGEWVISGFQRACDAGHRLKLYGRLCRYDSSVRKLASFNICCRSVEEQRASFAAMDGRLIECPTGDNLFEQVRAIIAAALAAIYRALRYSQ